MRSHRTSDRLHRTTFSLRDDALGSQSPSSPGDVQATSSMDSGGEVGLDREATTTIEDKKMEETEESLSVVVAKDADEGEDKGKDPAGEAAAPAAVVTDGSSNSSGAGSSSSLSTAAANSTKVDKEDEEEEEKEESAAASPPPPPANGRDDRAVHKLKDGEEKRKETDGRISKESSEAAAAVVEEEEKGGNDEEGNKGMSNDGKRRKTTGAETMEVDEANGKDRDEVETTTKDPDETDEAPPPASSAAAAPPAAPAAATTPQQQAQAPSPASTVVHSTHAGLGVSMTTATTTNNSNDNDAIVDASVRAVLDALNRRKVFGGDGTTVNGPGREAKVIQGDGGTAALRIKLGVPPSSLLQPCKNEVPAAPSSAASTVGASLAEAVRTELQQLLQQKTDNPLNDAVTPPVERIDVVDGGMHVVNDNDDAASGGGAMPSMPSPFFPTEGSDNQNSSSSSCVCVVALVAVVGPAKTTPSTAPAVDSNVAAAASSSPAPAPAVDVPSAVLKMPEVKVPIIPSAAEQVNRDDDGAGTDSKVVPRPAEAQEKKSSSTAASSTVMTSTKKKESPTQAQPRKRRRRSNGNDDSSKGEEKGSNGAAVPSTAASSSASKTKTTSTTAVAKRGGSGVHGFQLPSPGGGSSGSGNGTHHHNKKRKAAVVGGSSSSSMNVLSPRSVGGVNISLGTVTGNIVTHRMTGGLSSVPGGASLAIASSVAGGGLRNGTVLPGRGGGAGSRLISSLLQQQPQLGVGIGGAAPTQQQQQRQHALNNNPAFRRRPPSVGYVINTGDGPSGPGIVRIPAKKPARSSSSGRGGRGGGRQKPGEPSNILHAAESLQDKAAHASLLLGLNESASVASASRSKPSSSTAAPDGAASSSSVAASGLVGLSSSKNDGEAADGANKRSSSHHHGPGADATNAAGGLKPIPVYPRDRPKLVRHNYHDHSHEVCTDLDLAVESAVGGGDGRGGDHHRRSHVRGGGNHHHHGGARGDGGNSSPQERALGSAILKARHAKGFPIKLHDTLDRIAADGLDHIVSWQPHGRCFLVHRQREFTEHVLGQYFAMTKWTSFLRQLNLYGFQRLSAGRDKGGYYHELFLRGMKFLSFRMKRVKVNGNGIRVPGNADDEPKFYEMPYVNPPLHLIEGPASSDDRQQHHHHHRNRSTSLEEEGARGMVQLMNMKKSFSPR